MSILVNYIEENNNWYNDLLELCIRIKNDGNLYIFNYEHECPVDFYNPIVQECRGIILEIIDNKAKVVCWPFRKFGNYQEGYADNINWNNCKVQEKLDGRIVKLYYYDNKWIWSTNSQIYASKALLKTNGFYTFLDLIKNAVNYSSIDFNSLNTDFTYIFELTSPDQQIVIKYNSTQLYHIGTRSNSTGIEYDIDIGVKKPKEYKLNTLEDCIHAVSKLNIHDTVEHEGFVVVDNNFHRVKIKSAEYIFWHHKIVQYSIDKKNSISLILNNIDINKFITEHPSVKAQMYFYVWQVEELTNSVNEAIIYARNLYEEFSHDRKAVSSEIKKYKFSAMMFLSIDHPEYTALDIIKHYRIELICNYIEDYKRRKINDFSK